MKEEHPSVSGVIDFTETFEQTATSDEWETRTITGHYNNFTLERHEQRTGHLTSRTVDYEDVRVDWVEDDAYDYWYWMRETDETVAHRPVGGLLTGQTDVGFWSDNSNIDEALTWPVDPNDDPLPLDTPHAIDPPPGEMFPGEAPQPQSFKASNPWDTARWITGGIRNLYDNMPTPLRWQFNVRQWAGDRIRSTANWWADTVEDVTETGYKGPLGIGSGVAGLGALYGDVVRTVGGAYAGLIDIRGTALSTLDDLDESIDVADKYGWKEGLSRQIGVRQMYEAALDVSFDTGEAFDNQMDRVRHFSDGLARTSGTIGTVAGVGAGVQRFATPRVANVPGNAGRFPAEPDDFTKMLGVDPKVSTTKHGTRRYLWEPNSNTRIRFESHPGDTGAFNPRHHGEHYHIDVKPDNMTWNQAKKQNLITKVKPEDYILGHGTGHLPGELFPGQ